MIVVLDSRVLGFNTMRELYAKDLEFSPIIDNYKHDVHDAFSIQGGFIFKGSKLHISKSSFRELLIWEAHGGGLVGHFGINKTLEIVQENFY